MTGVGLRRKPCPPPPPPLSWIRPSLCAWSMENLPNRMTSLIIAPGQITDVMQTELVPHTQERCAKSKCRTLLYHEIIRALTSLFWSPVCQSSRSINAIGIALFVEMLFCVWYNREMLVRARILVQVTIYRRFLIGRDGHLNQSEAYDTS